MKIESHIQKNLWCSENQAELREYIGTHCPAMLSPRVDSKVPHRLFLTHGPMVITLFRYYSKGHPRYLAMILDMDEPDRLTISEFLILLRKTVIEYQKQPEQTAGQFMCKVLSTLQQKGIAQLFPPDPATLFRSN